MQEENQEALSQEEFESRFALGEVDLSMKKIPIPNNNTVEIVLARSPVVATLSQLEHLLQKSHESIPDSSILLTIGEFDSYNIATVPYTIDKHLAILNVFKMYGVSIYRVDGEGNREVIEMEDLYHTAEFNNLNNITDII